MATSLADQEVGMIEDLPVSAMLAHRTTTVEVQAPGDIARAMRQFDGDAFLSSVMGQALGKWFYSFKVAGKLIEGVSAEGAHEFARLRAEQGYAIRFPLDNVRMDEVREMGELGIRAMVIARDYRTGQEAIGVAFYPYENERTIEEEVNGEKVKRTVRDFDRFAGRKAVSVAQRNAILDLVPTKIVVAALQARAQIVAANEQQLAAEREAAISQRPEARKLTAGEATAATQDPYKGTGVANGSPSVPSAPSKVACPKCGGQEMYDNRAENAERRAQGKKERPDYKCKKDGCEGVIWPPKDGGQQQGMKF